MAIFEDKSEFKSFFEENYTSLSMYIQLFVSDREISEELAQDVFFTLWRRRDLMDSTINLKSYLFKMGRNRAVDHIRKTDRENKVKQSLVTETAPIESKDRSQVIKNAILRALPHLKPKTREIFWLHKFEGLTQKEIAEYLAIPKRTVEYQVANALLKLKELLSQDTQLNDLL